MHAKTYVQRCVTCMSPKYLLLLECGVVTDFMLGRVGIEGVRLVAAKVCAHHDFKSMFRIG